MLSGIRLLDLLLRKEEKMRQIRSKKDIHNYYFGVDAYSFDNGQHLSQLIDIFIKPRNEETSEIYYIFRLFNRDWTYLKSQMFYVSTTLESRYDKFNYNIGVMTKDSSFSYEEIIGKVGMVEIQNEVSNNKRYSNIIRFDPMEQEQFEKMLAEEINQ